MIVRDVLDTFPMRAAERRAAVAAFLSRAIVTTTIAYPDQLQTRFTAEAVGEVTISTFTSCAAPGVGTAVSHRTARHTRGDAEPSVMVNLQVSGASWARQDAHEGVLLPGQFALFDTGRPYERRYGGTSVVYGFRLPYGLLDLAPASVGALTARPLGRGEPAADIAAAYLSRLGRGDAESLVSTLAGADLLRTAILAASSPSGRHRLQASVQAHIAAFVLDHLGERDLDPARVASSVHLSRRHLYTQLARKGVAPAEWIRTLRLQVAHEQLARWPFQPIAGVARRCGFRDPAEFSRAFGRRYGMSPRSWQQTNRP